MEQIVSDSTADIRRKISLKMTVVARQARQKFDTDLEGLGVTRSQWTVIAVVSRRPGVTQRLIAEALDMSEAAAGRLVDRLCSDGLLERRAKEDDKRAHCVFMTQAAVPLMDRLGEIATRHEERSFRGIGDADLAKLNDLLDTLYNNINS